MSRQAFIRPETLALDKLIKATIARVEASPDGGAADTVLFLGNRHQSFPTAVIRDPVLEPVDKLVWMVIMLAVRETGANTAFPGYDDHCRHGQCFIALYDCPCDCHPACLALVDPLWSDA